MKIRKTFSIILCVVFIAVTSLAYTVLNFLSSNDPRGINTSSFAPARIIKTDGEDIIVKVYPTGGIIPHDPKFKDHPEISLNCIRKGWIIARYQGYCRLLFEAKDVDSEELTGRYGEINYFYAESIPQTRLRVTDHTAKLVDETNDPFNRDPHPTYMYYSIDEEKADYYSSRYGVLWYIAVDVIVVGLVIGVNLIISRKQAKARIN